MHQKIVQALKQHASKAKAEKSKRFFKTGKGQYGYGDVFIGLTVPEQRTIAKQYKDAPMNALDALLASTIHEHRLTALLIMVNQYKCGSLQDQKKIVELYLRNTHRVNNWDLVDSSADDILGTWLLTKKRTVLYKLARSNNLWERRIAIIATHAFIKNNDYADTLALAEILLHDSHDLIHKAVGWMLREIGKQDRVVLETFLDKHAPAMPRTMLRYAIEHFSKTKRSMYLTKQ